MLKSWSGAATCLFPYFVYWDKKIESIFYYFIDILQVMMLLEGRNCNNESQTFTTLVCYCTLQIMKCNDNI